MASYRWDDKDPNDILDYSIDWTDVLTGAEVIASVIHSISTVTGDASPLAIDTTQPSSGEPFTGTGTVVWLKLGTDGNTYHVTSKVTTNSGRVIDRKVRLRVKDL